MYWQLLNALTTACGDAKETGAGNWLPRNFKNLGDVMEAYEKQQAYFILEMVRICNMIEGVHVNLVPTPFLSSLISDCIDRGQDVMDGGARFNFSSPQGVGVANVADSMASIKKTGL